MLAWWTKLAWIDEIGFLLFWIRVIFLLITYFYVKNKTTKVVSNVQSIKGFSHVFYLQFATCYKWKDISTSLFLIPILY